VRARTSLKACAWCCVRVWYVCGGQFMQAKIVTICSTVAELGVFFAAAAALAAGLVSLR